MRLRSIVFFSLSLTACGAASQFHSPSNGTAFGNRIFCVSTADQPANAKFACGNEDVTVTVDVPSSGTAQFHRANRAGELPVEVVEISCGRLEPTPYQQCGFPKDTPAGTKVTLLLPAHAEFTLIRADLVEVDIGGSKARMVYPLDDNGRMFLSMKGLPPDVAASL